MKKKEENLGNNSQGSGTSGNNGNNETGSQGQTSENQDSNSGNGVNLKVIVPIVAGVALLIVVATLVVRKLKSSKISAGGINFEHDVVNVDIDDINNDANNVQNGNIIYNDKKDDNIDNDKDNNIDKDEYKNNNEDIIINNEKENNIDNNEDNNDNDEENNNNKNRDDNINFIIDNLSFDKEQAENFDKLLLNKKFYKAAFFVSDVLTNKLIKADRFTSDSGSEYAGIVFKAEKGIEVIKEEYKKSNGGAELGDDSKIFNGLKKIIEKCRNKLNDEYNNNLDFYRY